MPQVPARCVSSSLLHPHSTPVGPSLRSVFFSTSAFASLSLWPIPGTSHTATGCCERRGRHRVCVCGVTHTLLGGSLSLSPQALPGRVPPNAATIASPPGGKGSVASTGPAQGCLGSISQGPGPLSARPLGGGPSGKQAKGLCFVGARQLPRERDGPDWRATAPLSTVPVAASGTFNPLCRVLCILQSLYLCSIGPMLVFCLARDTPCTSNCSPKPLYSWMQTATPPATSHTQRCGGQYPSVVGHSRAFPGAEGHRWHCCLLHCPQHLLRSTKAVRRHTTTPLMGEGARGCCQWDSLRDEPGIASSLAVTGAIAVACSSATE